MQIFSKRFRQSIGQRLGHDRVVIVVLGLELLCQLVRANPRRDCESAKIIAAPRILRRDEIRQAIIGLSGRLLHLLPQKMEARDHFRPRLIAIDFDVVA